MEIESNILEPERGFNDNVIHSMTILLTLIVALSTMNEVITI